MKNRLLNLNIKKIFNILLLVILFSYFGIWNSFFQQDEWSGLGRYYSLSSLSIESKMIAYYEPLFKSGIAHFLPFLPIVNLIRYGFFGLSYEPYAILSLLLHVFSSLSVFWLIKIWSRDNLAALISSIVFAILPNGSQAVTWVGTSLPTQFAFLFSTFSVGFWLKWLESNKRKELFISLVFAVLAIGFKETALFLFIFLPFLYVFIKKRFEKKLAINLLLLVLFYAVLRFFVAFIGNNTTESFTTLYGFFKNAFSNYLTVVPRGFGQIFIPQEILYKLFQSSLILIGKITNTSLFFDPIFLEKFLVRPALYITGFVIILILLIKRKYFYFAYIMCSLIPIVFITEGELNGLFLPSRSLYIPLIGAVGVVGEFGSNILKNKKYLASIVLCFYILINLMILKYQNNLLIREGKIRKEILNTISSQNPILGDKVIIYIESDSSYYGLPSDTKILPFQSGLGKTLLVWLSKDEAFPPEFFDNDFLWDISAQGYKEVEGRGFGYFREKSLLTETIKKYNIASESLIGYKWHSRTNSLQNVTIDLRREMEINEKNTK